MINRDDYKNPDMEVTTTLLPPSEEIIDNRPVVLFVGIEVSTYSSKSMIKGWEELGFRVEFINYQILKMEIGVHGMWGRIMGKAAMVNPAIIFLNIQNEEAINVETCIRLNKIAPVVAYSFDCRSYSKTIWLYDLAQNITLTCCSNEDDVIQCAIRGANAMLVPSSADYDLYQSRKKIRSVSGNDPEIVFIGQNYSNTNAGFEKAKERQEIIDFLYENYPMQFYAVGMGQVNSRYVHPNEEIGFYHTAKIIIGHSNFYRSGYSSDRLYRAMGSGAFYLTSYFPDMEDTFKDGIHLDSYQTKQELKDKIDYYLSHDAKRQEIAESGALFVRSYHRWQDRFKQVVDSLKLK